ncbi:MAG: LptF/LptG family permease, partial [Verrucomicrobiota bacterium]
MALAATVSILILERLYDDLPDFIGWRATTAETIRYFALYTPSFLPTVIPISLLLSLLFALGNLHRNNEIIAMRAAGMNLFRITRGLWIAGIVLSGLLLYLNARLVPWSVEESRLLKDNLRFSAQAEKQENESQVGRIGMLTFDNLNDGRLWFMNDFSEYTYEGFGMNVYLRDEAGREVGRVVAREGYFDDAEGYWVFLNGRHLEIDPETGEVYRFRPFEVRSYEDFTEDPTLMKTLIKKPQDLSFFELQMLLEK